MLSSLYVLSLKLIMVQGGYFMNGVGGENDRNGVMNPSLIILVTNL